VEDAKASIPSLVVQGINPATGIGTGIGFLLMGPQREKDPTFKHKIDRYLESYNWQIDDYFFQALKNGTSLSLNREIADDFIFDRFGRPIGETAKLGKQNVLILFSFMIMPKTMGGWTEPKYILMASVGIVVATEDTLRLISAKFPGQSPIFSRTYSGQKQSGSELRMMNNYPEMYIGSIYKNSDYHTKEQWLSNNGAFLEEQLKSAMTYLAKETDRLFFIIK